MANPMNKLSVDAATATSTGVVQRLRGHYHTTLFVAVAGTLDTGNDTLDVQLEGSPDRDRWHTIASVSAGDFEEDPDSGEWTAYVGVTGEYVEYIRANVTGYADDANDDLGAVDAYLMSGGNAGQGVRGNPDG